MPGVVCKIECRDNAGCPFAAEVFPCSRRLQVGEATTPVWRSNSDRDKPELGRPTVAVQTVVHVMIESNPCSLGVEG
jgi:hypothetical protein